MTELTIESPRPFPWGAVVFALLAAAGFTLAAATQSLHWALAATLPLMLAGAVALTGPPAFSGRLTSEGLEIGDGPSLIPFGHIQGLWSNGKIMRPEQMKRQRFTIDLAHLDGILRIPPPHHVRSSDLYRFLYEQLSASGSRSVNPEMLSYLQQQEGDFGADRVFTYVARHYHPGRLGQSRRLAVVGAFLATGLVWAVVGFSFKGGEAWGVFGCMMAFLSLLFGLLFWNDARQAPGRIKNWRQSSLILSPVGLAMIQGEVRGEMRWDELRDVKLKAESAMFSTSVGQGIILRVEGADLVIHDLYDRPLPLIQKQIRLFWRREGA
jgi:hypothetical protein